MKKIKLKKSWLVGVSILVPALIITNLFFVNATPVGDLPPPGSTFLGQGGNANAYRLGNDVYKIIHNGDTVTRNQILVLHNSLAQQMGNGLIPPYEAVGNNTLKQSFADGLKFSDLSIAAQKEARANVKALEKEAGKAAGQAWLESAKPQPPGRVYTMPNGSFAMIDIGGLGGDDGNYRFTGDGKIKSWFDPVSVGNIGDLDSSELVGARTIKPSLTTPLPIDNGEKLKVTPDPTATGAAGLKSVKVWTFLGGAMSLAGAALIVNDYKNQYNAATNSDQKADAHSNFLKSMATMVGVGLAAGAIIIGLGSVSTVLAATASVAFVAVGAVGLGTHISATFNNDILNLWDKIEARMPTKPDSSHPSYAKLRDYQRQTFQIELKRVANTEGRSTIEFRDVARVAVMHDPDFKQVFYSPSTKKDDPIKTGSFLSDVRTKELEAFRRLADVYHDVRQPNPTQERAQGWARELAKIPIVDLKNFQDTFKVPINYPTTFGNRVQRLTTDAVFLLKKFNSSQDYKTYLNTSETLEAIASRVGGGINISGTTRKSKAPSHKAPTTSPAAGTTVVPVNGIAPSYNLAPFYNGEGQTGLENNPQMVKLLQSGGPTPLKTGMMTIIPGPGGVGCFDYPTEIRFLGNGAAVERNLATEETRIVPTQVVEPKDGASPLGSFAFREVTSNGTYQVNGGMQDCSAYWVPACGVTTAVPWTPATSSSGGIPSWCIDSPTTPGCPCYYTPYEAGCF